MIWLYQKKPSKILIPKLLFSFFLLKNAGVILTNEKVVASEKKGASFKPHCGENIYQKCAKKCKR